MFRIVKNADALGDLLQTHKQVFQLLCGQVHRPIHTVWRGVTVTIAPIASHYVALDLHKGVEITSQQLSTQKPFAHSHWCENVTTTKKTEFHFAVQGESLNDDRE